MRHESTLSENKFWWRVRNRHLGRYKFKRQYLIGNYIVDFVCVERLLIIEVDGGQHALQQAYDRARDEFLASRGFQVMRIWSSEVMQDIEGVLEAVLTALEHRKAPSP